MSQQPCVLCDPTWLRVSFDCLMFLALTWRGGNDILLVWCWRSQQWFESPSRFSLESISPATLDLSHLLWVMSPHHKANCQIQWIASQSLWIQLAVLSDQSALSVTSLTIKVIGQSAKQADSKLTRGLQFAVAYQPTSQPMSTAYVMLMIFGGFGSS